MVEFGDFLFKASPLILGLLALFIVPAAQRKQAQKSDDLEVTQGKTIEFGEVDYVKRDILQEREIHRLQMLCERNGLNWEAKKPKEKDYDG